MAKDIFMFMEEMDGDFESHTDGHEIDEVKRNKMQEWLEEVGCQDHVRYFGDCKKVIQNVSANTFHFSTTY